MHKHTKYCLQVLLRYAQAQSSAHCPWLLPCYDDSAAQLQQRLYVANRAWCIYCPALYRKRLPTPALKQHKSTCNSISFSLNNPKSKWFHKVPTSWKESVSEYSGLRAWTHRHVSGKTPPRNGDCNIYHICPSSTFYKIWFWEHHADEKETKSLTPHWDAYYHREKKHKNNRTNAGEEWENWNPCTPLVQI